MRPHRRPDDSLSRAADGIRTRPSAWRAVAEDAFVSTDADFSSRPMPSDYPRLPGVWTVIRCGRASAQQEVLAAHDAGEIAREVLGRVRDIVDRPWLKRALVGRWPGAAWPPERKDGCCQSVVSGSDASGSCCVETRRRFGAQPPTPWSVGVPTDVPTAEKPRKSWVRCLDRLLPHCEAETALRTCSLRCIACHLSAWTRPPTPSESPANQDKCAQGDSNSHGPNGPQGPQPCASTSSATGA
jgi:hypothetical protein